MVFGVERIGAGEAGIGCGADDDLGIGELGLQLLYYCFCGVDFADADGVNPDTFFLRILAGDFSESISPAESIAFVSDHSV